MRFRIGRYDVPRCVGSRCGRKRVGVGGLIIVPVLARLDVAGVELPLLFRIIGTCLLAAALLVFRDVLKALQNRGAGLGQQRLELSDIAIAPLALFAIERAEDTRYQHVFVVAAIEDRQLAAGRHLRMNTP